MDLDRFARIVARAGSRRTAVTGTIGAGLLSLLSHASEPVTPARGKKKKKPCKNGKRRCAGTCRNVQTDPENCGRCGKVCATEERCRGGVCRLCPADETECSGVCRNLSTDPANCGTCGQSCISGECSHGACECPSGSVQDCNEGCVCQSRKDGGLSCGSGQTLDPCQTDDDCPLGSFCLISNFCSFPCVG